MDLKIHTVFWLILHAVFETAVEAATCQVDIQAFGTYDSDTSGHIRVNDVTYLETDQHDTGIYFAQLFTCKGSCRIQGGIQHFDIGYSSAQSSACKDYINNLSSDTFLLSVTASDTWGNGLHAGTCLDELERRDLVQILPYGDDTSVVFVAKVGNNTGNMQNQSTSGSYPTSLVLNIETASVPENCERQWVENVEPAVDVTVSTLSTFNAPQWNPMLTCARACAQTDQCRSFHTSASTGQCILYDGLNPNAIVDSFFFMDV